VRIEEGTGGWRSEIFLSFFPSWVLVEQIRSPEGWLPKPCLATRGQIDWHVCA